MSSVIIQDTSLTEIADAIRETHKIEGSIPTLQMAAKIREPILGYLDTTLITMWGRWFQHGQKIETADFINTCNGLDFDSMFDNFTDVNYNYNNRSSEKLKEIIKKLDFRKGLNFSYFCSNNPLPIDMQDITIKSGRGMTFDSCFKSCSNMTHAPKMITYRGTSFLHMYYGCTNMESIGSENIIDVSAIKPDESKDALLYAFAECKKLTDLTIKTNYNENKALNTDALERMFYRNTGLTNLTIQGKIKVNSDDFSLAYCGNLTMQSVENIIDAFVDNTGEETTYTVFFSTNTKNLLAQPENEYLLERLSSKNISLG